MTSHAYDGTLATINIANSLRSKLEALGPALQEQLDYKYRTNPPTRTTLYRWVKEGLMPLPHEREGGRFEARKIDAVDEVYLNPLSAFQEKYKDRNFWAIISWKRIRGRAKSRGLEFDLTWKDLVPPDECPVLGITLTIGGGRSYKSQETSPSVDRIDNTKGYVKSNVRVISKRANSLKSDANIEEIERVLAYMKSSLQE